MQLLCLGCCVLANVEADTALRSQLIPIYFPVLLHSAHAVSTFRTCIALHIIQVHFTALYHFTALSTTICHSTFHKNISLHFLQLCFTLHSAKHFTPLSAIIFHSAFRQEFHSSFCNYISPRLLSMTAYIPHASYAYDHL